MSSRESSGWSRSDADPLNPMDVGFVSAGSWLVLFLQIGSFFTPALSGPKLEAQEPAPPSAEYREGRGWLRSILGRSPDRDRVIFGLWVMHPFEPQFPEIDGTRGLGGLYGHWFGTTFVNSYDERTFALGIERDWLRFGVDGTGVGVGYRVGLIAGYDERLVEIAGHTPVLPFAGVVVWGRVGPVAVDSYYVYRAITLETSLVF